MDNKYKALLPKLITYSRLGFIPIILLLTYFEFYTFSLIIVLIGFLSDYLDNFLSKKWNIISLTDTKIDIVISKLFELIMLFICKMYLVVIIDIIYITINLIFYYKNKKVHILDIGYFKEILFMILIIFSYINIYITNISFINGIIYSVVNIQLISIYYYITYNIKYKKPSINNNLMHESILNIKNLEDTIIYEK